MWFALGRLACLFYPGKGRIITYPRTTATYNWYLQNQMKKFSLHSVQQSLVAESVLVGWTLYALSVLSISIGSTISWF